MTLTKNEFPLERKDNKIKERKEENYCVYMCRASNQKETTRNQNHERGQRELNGEEKFENGIIVT